MLRQVFLLRIVPWDGQNSWVPSWALWTQAAGASSGYAEKLLHCSSLALILQMRLHATQVQAQRPCCLSAVGGHRMAVRQSPEQIHLQPFCLSHCRQRRRP